MTEAQALLALAEFVRDVDPNWSAWIETVVHHHRIAHVASDGAVAWEPCWTCGWFEEGPCPPMAAALGGLYGI